MAIQLTSSFRNPFFQWEVNNEEVPLPFFGGGRVQTNVHRNIELPNLISEYAHASSSSRREIVLFQDLQRGQIVTKTKKEKELRINLTNAMESVEKNSCQGCKTQV